MYGLFADCLNGFERIIPDRPFCHLFVGADGEDVTWDDARDRCMSWYGTHLVHVTDSTEDAAITTILNTSKIITFII